MKQAEDRIETLLVAAIELRYMAADDPRFGSISLALARALEDIALTERKRSAPGVGYPRPREARKTAVAAGLGSFSPQHSMDRSD
jgi:hypothetical protein